MRPTFSVSIRILALLAVLSFFSSGCSLLEDILGAIARRCAVSTLTVTYTADTNSGSCVAGSCSLRQAISLSNICPGVQTIEIPGEWRYYLTTTGAGEDRNLSGDLDITDSVDIVGGHSPILDGNHSDRIFDVHAGATVNLTGLLLTNGYTRDGGAIRNAGILNVHNCTIEENFAWDDTLHEGGQGGGILSTGESLTVDGTMLTGNGASQGGGIAVVPSDLALSPSLVLTYSTLSGNLADQGAGLYLPAYGLDFAVATLAHFHIDGNETFPAPLGIGDGMGGGIWNAANLTLNQGEITGNHAVYTGGGIYNIGQITADQVVLQNNRAPSGSAIYTERVTTTRPDEFGVANFSRSAIVNNWNADPLVASPLPGDIHNDGVIKNMQGDLSLNNTTVGRNMGNGIGNYGGNLQINFSTITENDRYQLGGDAASRTTVANSIVSDRFYIACVFDDPSTVTSNGFNIDSSDECNFHNSTDRTATDPLLLPLATVAGTSVYPLASGSPALDSADPAHCSGTDQRGVTRPQGPACDRGAYEVETGSTTAPLIYATPTPEATKSGIIVLASPTPSSTPAGLAFGQPGLSVDHFYSGGAGCGPLDLKLQVGVSDPAQVSSVVLFYHLEDKAGGASTPWNDGVAMESLGSGQYSYDLVSNTIPAFNSYPEAWLVYQFAATNGGQVVLRSPAFKDVTLSMCGKK
jgi:CSLREA domain-containing protein